MALETQPYLVDDLEILENPAREVRADKTIHFAVDGEEYEIDLTAHHADDFMKMIRPYRMAGRRKKRTRRKQAPLLAASPKDIREWAKKKGLRVNEIGRVPLAIVAQYEAAHPRTAKSGQGAPPRKM